MRLDHGAQVFSNIILDVSVKMVIFVVAIFLGVGVGNEMNI